MMGISKFTRLAAILFLAAPLASAGVVYYVAIDTSSLSGNGGIYFQFGGGLNPDLASIRIDTFTIGAPGALLSSPAPIPNGGVSGSLALLPLAIDNSMGLNDYTQFLTFGSDLFFTVEFLQPAILTGDSGSAFTFGLTSIDGISPLLSLDPSGFIGQISYDTDGAFTTDTLGNETVETIGTVTADIPEPATGGLLLAGALAALCVRWRRRRIPL